MIVIWGRDNCGYCTRAVDLCDQYDFKYEYIKVDTPQILEQLEQKVPGVKTVPQIFWNDKHIGGYEDFAAEIENTRNFGQEKI